MDKKCLFCVCLVITCILVSGCSIEQVKSPINYQRRLEKYLPNENTKQRGGTVDLSEGQKIKYDAKFGPKDLNFDMKFDTQY